MEKYSQFRDKGTAWRIHLQSLRSMRTAVKTNIHLTGTAIAPFLPVPAPPSSFVWTPIHAFTFICRLPLVISISFIFFGILEWIPGISAVKYVVLWLMLGIPGVWWVDLQVDGVKRG